MPDVGDIKSSLELGKKGNPSQKYRWTPCIICGIPRWMTMTHFKKKQSMRCRHCGALGYGGEKHSRWNGGRFMHDGYIFVRVSEDSPFRPMATKKGYVREHRLVMAKMIGRCLQPFEFPHHKNGVKSDNRPENLELTMPGAHIREHNRGYTSGYVKGLTDGRLVQIRQLQERIKELEGQLGFFNVELPPKVSV